MKPRIARVAPGSLPALYAGWIADALGGPIPAETAATCSDCAMCAGPGERPGIGRAFFDPAVKCCTFMPVLPNFLVGRILSDTDPDAAHGRASVLARIRAGLAVTPLGLGRPAKYDVLYEYGPEAFGRSRVLRCPHFIEQDGGRCGIWRHREAECATYFCKYVRGAVGQAFWDAVRRLLGAVETSLARWCLTKLDVASDALQRLVLAVPLTAGERLTAAEIDERVDPAAYRQVWGAWAGRERAFYVRCARLVRELSWRRVLDICDPEVRILGGLARAGYEQLMSRELPATACVAPLQLLALNVSHVGVVTYNEEDPLRIPVSLLNVLHYFDGRPTQEAIAAIAREEHLDLEDGVVRKLVDFRVLIEPSRGNQERARESPVSARR